MGSRGLSVALSLSFSLSLCPEYLAKQSIIQKRGASKQHAAPHYIQGGGLHGIFFENGESGSVVDAIHKESQQKRIPRRPFLPNNKIIKAQNNNGVAYYRRSVIEYHGGTLYGFIYGECSGAS